MTISADVRKAVRHRAGRACEYCEVTDVDWGGILTVDHFQPVAVGGNDSLDNLIYCCPRCNQYKADYWPSGPSSPKLWNPRQQGRGDHFLETEDGGLHGLTPEASFTILRLRLNRLPLVQYRIQRRKRADILRLLARYGELIGLQDRLQAETERLLAEQQDLLLEQRTLLDLLLKRLE